MKYKNSLQIKMIWKLLTIIKKGSELVFDLTNPQKY